MKIASPPRLAASLASLALWALVAASALYWVWRVRTPPLADVLLAGHADDLEPAADAQAVARALGAAGARVAGDANGRFVLRGVITHGTDSGAALIAVNGKPSKPVRVGAPVQDADGWTLRAVTPRGAVLVGGAHEITLDVPQPDSHLDTHAALLDSRAPVAASLANRNGLGMMAPPQPPHIPSPSEPSQP